MWHDDIIMKGGANIGITRAIPLQHACAGKDLRMTIDPWGDSEAKSLGCIESPIDSSAGLFGIFCIVGFSHVVRSCLRGLLSTKYTLFPTVPADWEVSPREGSRGALTDVEKLCESMKRLCSSPCESER